MKRRKFIQKATLASFAAALGTPIVYGKNLRQGSPPILLQDQDPYQLFDLNPEMVVLNNRPWNIEAKAHLLDEKITSSKNMFIRNNGHIPENVNTESWTITFDGESLAEKRTFTLAELKNRFEHYTYQLTLECGGNGRSEFDPPAKGNQWTIGAVSCAQWTGVRLRDVLEFIGLADSAVYIGYHAADTHLSGDPAKEPISRGVPLSKALQDETLLAFEMNGQPIPLAHGYPLRMVAGGWPASASGKWITGISVRNKVHDGPKMTGTSYRVPCSPIAPGEEVDDEDFCIIESMPVKSLITYPKSGAILSKGKRLNIRGHAWAGELEVQKMEYSIDFGSTWKTATLERPANRLSWQHFSTSINFPEIGYYEVWARATDSKGKSQPMVLPGWNPKGYLNNASHRIAIRVQK